MLLYYSIPRDKTPYKNAHITAMRHILGQSVYHLNLFHGFRHISLPKEKFSHYIKQFKNKIVDDLPLTVQTKQKTIDNRV